MANVMYAAKPAVYIGGCGIHQPLELLENGLPIGCAVHALCFAQVKSKRETS